VPPRKEWIDTLGRPFPVCEGSPIGPLFG
jgi:hypothetical protein